MQKHLTFTRDRDTKNEFLAHREIPNISANSVILVEDINALSEKFNCVNTWKAVILNNTGTKLAMRHVLLQFWRKRIKESCTQLAVPILKINFHF